VRADWGHEHSSRLASLDLVPGPNRACRRPFLTHACAGNTDQEVRFQNRDRKIHGVMLGRVPGSLVGCVQAMGRCSLRWSNRDSRHRAENDGHFRVVLLCDVVRRFEPIFFAVHPCANHGWGG